jgi:hypothetical protein
MGGKSRKSGGVSLKLIQKLKSGNINTNKSNCGSNKPKSTGDGFFTGGNERAKNNT